MDLLSIAAPIINFFQNKATNALQKLKITHELTPKFAIEMGSGSRSEDNENYEFKTSFMLTNKGGPVDITKYELEYRYASSGEKEGSKVFGETFTLTNTDVKEVPLTKKAKKEPFEPIEVYIKITYTDPIQNHDREKTLPVTKLDIEDPSQKPSN